MSFKAKNLIIAVSFILLFIGLSYQVFNSTASFLLYPTFVKTIFADQKDSRLPDVTLCFSENVLVIKHVLLDKV